MNKIIQNQINKLTQELNYKIIEGNGIDDFKEIIFNKKSFISNKKEVRVTFEKYFVTGYNGFDFHEKFNKGVYPTDIVMVGSIEKETEKMYYFKLHDEMNERQWEGYCPKKCCTIEEMRM